MSEKVKLPREVAEAIEVQRNKEGLTKYGMIGLWETMKYPEQLNANLQVMKGYFKNKNADFYVEVVVNGYEVEMTPEEKVTDYFNRLRAMRDTAATGMEERELNVELNGALQVLEYLGIKISGVNAE